MYRAWRREAAAGLEICALQLPGREARIRETPFRRIGDAVSAVSAELRPFLDRPFAFFGYSMGALIAYELVRALRSDGGVGPIALCVAAAGAPRDRSGANERRLHALPDAAFKDALRELSGTPEAVLEHEELMELMLPVLRADFELHETYRIPEAGELRLDCPILAFGGDDDPNVPREDLEAWNACTSAEFRAVIYPGHHFFFETSATPMLRAVSSAMGVDPS